MLWLSLAASPRWRCLDSLVPSHVRPARSDAVSEPGRFPRSSRCCGIVCTARVDRHFAERVQIVVQKATRCPPARIDACRCKRGRWLRSNKGRCNVFPGRMDGRGGRMSGKGWMYCRELEHRKLTVQSCQRCAVTVIKSTRIAVKSGVVLP